MIIEDYTIGADPELFIINEETGKVVSSIGLIPGEKGNPYRAEDMPEGFGLEIDNILAEFNIPPVSDELSFINNIQYMKDYINSYVKNKNKKLGIKCIASMSVDPDQLKSKEAKEFGCCPDFNVYTESENPRPQGTRTNTRSAGFHIHIGYRNPNIDTSLKLVRYLDMYLGIPSVVEDPDKKRRSLYGKAGAFRLCGYGVEYRVLSSAMMKDKDMLKKVWKGIQKAIRAYNEDRDFISRADVEAAINNSDVDLAKALIRHYNLV